MTTPSPRADLIQGMSAFFALAALLVTLSGCDEIVDPPNEIEAYYTLWGAFDPEATTQAIRVVPISDTISTGSPTPIDATVYSVDLTSGAETMWRDSLIEFSNGSYGHVFLSDFQPAYGSRHRLFVERSDGVTTEATLRVPPRVEPILQEPIDLPGDVGYPVLWPGAPQLNNISVSYFLEDGGCNTLTLETEFQGEADPFEFGWTTTQRLEEDAGPILQELDARPHAVLRITLRAEVAGSDWRPPGGTFDPEVIIEPGTFSNVERGFGFVGAAYTVSVHWSPTGFELTRAGFRTPGFGDCARAL